MPARPYTVHVVAHDDGLRDSLGLLLKAYGYAVRDYAAGSDFLAVVTSEDQGSLVLDYTLSDMNGLDIVTALSEREIQLPVLLLTDIADSVIERHARRLGVRHILEKPCGGTELLRLIDEMRHG